MRASAAGAGVCTTGTVDLAALPGAGCGAGVDGADGVADGEGDGTDFSAVALSCCGARASFCHASQRRRMEKENTKNRINR